MAELSTLMTTDVADAALATSDEYSESASARSIGSNPPGTRAQRVRWASRATTAATVAAIAVGVLLMLPRLHSVRLALGHVRHAQPGWLAACVIATLTTCVASAYGLRAAVGHRLPIRRMMQLELAASTANRFAPGGIGGVGVKSLYLCRHGVTPPEAAAALGTVGLIGATVHVTALTVTTVVTGGQVEIPLPLLFGIGAAMIALAGATALTQPQGRLRTMLRRARRAVTAILHDPHRLRVLVGSATAVTACNVVALAFACRSVGAEASWFTIASIYLTGRAVAAAAPTPNGLGATEAAMIAGFATAGVVGPVALAAVLVYRLVSFWLPIVPGVVSARRLRAA